TKGVATITLNQPEKHNAFDDKLIAELTNQLLKLNNDNAVRVVVLTGAGKSFSAGADINWMRSMAGFDEAQNIEDSLKLAELMSVLDSMHKPTVARVNGAAIGGGTGLVACCDIAIAADSAKFAFSEVRLGLVPAVISPYVIAAIGPRQARRYFLTAERFDAAEAARIGLVHSCVAADKLDAAVDAVINDLLAGGPQALTASKQLIANIINQDVSARETAKQMTSQLIAQLRVSEEGQEGLGAFLEKRKPKW
ncbi:MAG TPA: enoyl-CoA hydratase/isomerase family protein, partial [Gammaproteobacteria bacterium]|nr:enoyl-CoA hydratase/isomerase family protein [Gammaproteobacteria bacterium]